LPRSLRDFIQESGRGGRDGGDYWSIIVIPRRIARAGPAGVPSRTARAGLAVAIPCRIAGRAALAVLEAVKGKAKEKEDIRAYIKDLIHYCRIILSRVLDGRTDRT